MQHVSLTFWPRHEQTPPQTVTLAAMAQMRLFQNRLPRMPQACPSEEERDEVAEEVGGPSQREERHEPPQGQAVPRRHRGDGHRPTPPR